MRRVYIDTSALLRLLFAERGPKAPFGGASARYASEVIEIETFRTLDRARLAGRLDDMETARKSKELAELLETLHLVPLSREVTDLARATFPVPVRALDAIHVATAQWLQRELDAPLEFWTHDRRQAAAALCRALAVHGADG